jgi:hypothetical protein
MNQSQKVAVRRYRDRQKRKGIVRMEISVPEGDKPLIREIAANLRAGGELAKQTRSALCSLMNPWAGMNLKELIENAPPLDELDLERSKETARDIDL